MKTLASLLILMIALHGACMAQCVGEGSHAVKEATAPPCEHHQSGTPNGTDSPAPSTTCSEGPALEAKTSPLVKCSLSPAAIPGVITTPATCLHDSVQAHQAEAGPPGSFHIVRFFILRI